MKIVINIPNPENINPTSVQVEKYTEVVTALITSGGLDGVKAGRTILHFDPDGAFKAVELQYFPWKKRKAVL